MIVTSTSAMGTQIVKVSMLSWDVRIPLLEPTVTHIVLMMETMGQSLVLQETATAVEEEEVEVEVLVLQQQKTRP